MTIATEYANLCDIVVAPTGSVERLIRKRGVRVPVEVIPTGIDVGVYGNGGRSDFRRRHGIPLNAFVLGYLGRVVEAKNMGFLTRAAVQFLQKSPNSWFLVVGDGESVNEVRRQTREGHVSDRVVMTGSLTGRAVADAYAAMDLFAFASKTETQGIVLIESLCAGVPVVALDAPGSRDILQDNRNGILVNGDASYEDFAVQLHRLKEDTGLRSRLSAGARQRARDFDRKRCAERLLAVCGRLGGRKPNPHADEGELWPLMQERFAAEWDLFREKLSVVAAAIAGGKTS
jgi:glycosyltransferase involved in cell wall biosynthesis